MPDCIGRVVARTRAHACMQARNGACASHAQHASCSVPCVQQVLLFTRSLAKSMGYRAQLALYAYYLLTAAGLRAMSPPLALMTAQETGLAGAFRSAHQVALWHPPGGAVCICLCWCCGRRGYSNGTPMAV